MHKALFPCTMMGSPGPHHLQPPKYFWESSRNVSVFFTLRSHCETTCCRCQNWTPCPCPYEATQHLTECPDYHSVPHPHCAQARGGLCCDKENPAPPTHTPHVSHSTTGPLLPHTEIFVETTLRSFLSPPLGIRHGSLGSRPKGDLPKIRHQAAVRTAFPSDD